MTRKENRAQKINRLVEQHCARVKKYQRLIDLHWQVIAKYIQVIHDEELYADLGLDSFDEYLEQHDIGRGWAYDLVRIEHSPHRDKLKELPISKARLILPALKNCNDEQAERIINAVASTPSWNEARQTIKGDDRNDTWFDGAIECDHCHYIIELQTSKAVQIVVTKSRRK